jgi:hypothetical protein
MKRLFAVVVLLAVACTAYLGFTATDTVTAPAAVAAAKTYSATVYVAGMGGHFTKADVIIDPANAADPIKINGIDRIVIGDKTTHPTHDARIDSNDPNTMFWSTYVLDPQGKMHVGKSDLKTGKVIKDVAMTPDPKATGAKPPLYCASGQSKSNYMPVFMGSEGYVDVLDKNSLELKHRVFVNQIGYAAGTYKFVHGINSPDMKKFLLSINQAKEGKGTGDVDLVLLDMAELEKGKMKVLKKNTLKGEPDKTLTFRQYFSNDGKLIFQSAADRLWVIDAATLKLVDEKMMPAGNQLHDAMPTPDGQYAILTVRTVTAGCDAEGKAIPGKDITDGTFMLYDAGAKKLNEKTTSACLACHKGMGQGDKNAVLCGLDANYKK